MTINEATKGLLNQLSLIYDERESAAITDWVMDYLTAWKKSQRVIYKNEELAASKSEHLQKISKQLLTHKPVQYVLNESWFRGMKLYVDEHVLIPRPETEELVDWALGKDISKKLSVNSKKVRVLDVGTGSGCIPIAIKKERPEWEVYACDISKGALAVARKNAAEYNAKIELMELNFLDKDQRSLLPQIDLIISNPPYIAEDEKSTIDKHVIEYEPHLALFVPEEDSLIFYRVLADFGKSHLIKGGCMLMEFHFEKAEAVRKLFNQNGYETELRKDMHGNDRMIKAWHS